MSAPKAGVSNREFAELDGCNEKLVREGRKSKRLETLADGSIDPALAGSAWRKSNRVKGNARARKLSAKSPQAPTEGPQGDADAPPEGLESYAEAELRKENYLAMLRQLEFEVKSRKLVDRETYEQKVAELALQDRESWTNWPARVAPLMAPELGVEQVKLAVILEKFVRDHLLEQSDPALR